MDDEQKADLEAHEAHEGYVEASHNDTCANCGRVPYFVSPCQFCGCCDSCGCECAGESRDAYDYDPEDYL